MQRPREQQQEEQAATSARSLRSN